LARPVPERDNEREVDKIIKEAPTVARVRVVHQRMVVASMETRGATGEYDKAHDSYTLHACSQSADAMRGQAASIMGVPNEKLRVTTADVGGAFGMKTTCYPEYIAVLVAAPQGRAAGALAVDAFGGLRQRRASPRRHQRTPNSRSTAKASSWPCACGICAIRRLCANAGININTNNFARCLPGMYRIAKGRRRRRLLFHQQGADRALPRCRTAEANYALERVVEEAARVTGIVRSSCAEEFDSAIGDAVQDADQYL